MRHTAPRVTIKWRNVILLFLVLLILYLTVHMSENITLFLEWVVHPPWHYESRNILPGYFVCLLMLAAVLIFVRILVRSNRRR